MLKNIIEKVKNVFNGAKAKKENKESDYEKMKDQIEQAKNDYLTETVDKNGSRADLKRFADDEIKEIAERILAEDYDSEKTATLKKLNATLDKYSEKKSKAEADYAEKSSSEEAKSEKNKTELKDGFMENGIARSSVAKLKEEEIDSDKAEKLKVLSDLRDSTVKLADERTEEAKKQAEKENAYTQNRYENDLAKEYAKLKNLAGTKYGDSLTDKEKAEEYSSKIVNYVGEYLKGLFDEEVKNVLENDLYLKSVTTEKERKYLKDLYLK